MTREELDAAAKLLNSQVKDGWTTPSEEATFVLHLAKGASTMSIAKVAAYKLEGSLVLAKTAKQELTVFTLADIFALSVDPTAGGAARRPAGFQT
jgi:hypothetical protein